MGGFVFVFLFVCFHLFFISWRLVTLQYCSGFCPPYMQNRKRDTDVQNRLLDSMGEGEGGMFQENSMETLMFISCDLYLKQIILF